MIARCECGHDVEWVFVREFTDWRGRKWEVYRCPLCGFQRDYAVG